MLRGSRTRRYWLARMHLLYPPTHPMHAAAAAAAANPCSGSGQPVCTHYGAHPHSHSTRHGRWPEHTQADPRTPPNDHTTGRLRHPAAREPPCHCRITVRIRPRESPRPAAPPMRPPQPIACPLSACAWSCVLARCAQPTCTRAAAHTPQAEGGVPACLMTGRPGLQGGCHRPACCPLSTRSPHSLAALAGAACASCKPAGPPCCRATAAAWVGSPGCVGCAAAPLQAAAACEVPLQPPDRVCAARQACRRSKLPRTQSPAHGSARRHGSGGPLPPAAELPDLPLSPPPPTLVAAFAEHERSMSAAK